MTDRHLINMLPSGINGSQIGSFMQKREHSSRQQSDQDEGHPQNQKQQEGDHPDNQLKMHHPYVDIQHSKINHEHSQLKGFECATNQHQTNFNNNNWHEAMSSSINQFRIRGGQETESKEGSGPQNTSSKDPQNKRQNATKLSLGTLKNNNFESFHNKPSQNLQFNNMQMNSQGIDNRNRPRLASGEDFITKQIYGGFLGQNLQNKDSKKSQTNRVKNFISEKKTSGLSKQIKNDESEYQSKLGLDYDDEQIALSEIDIHKSSIDETSSEEESQSQRESQNIKNAIDYKIQKVPSQEGGEHQPTVQKIPEDDEVIHIDLAQIQKENEIETLNQGDQGDQESNTTKKLFDNKDDLRSSIIEVKSLLGGDNQFKSTAVDDMNLSRNSFQMKKLITSHQLKSFDKASMFFFKQDSYLRVLICIILKSVYFETFMLLAVISNCVMLGYFEILREKNISTHDHHLKEQYETEMDKIDSVNIAFTFLYLVESVMKGISYGVIMHQKSYLRIGWSWIDVGVLLQGFLELIIPPKASLVVRSLRSIFRPLKCINVMPSVKQLLQSLIGSLPEFGNVAIFMIFVFVLFATMGLQQYNGQTQNSCRLQKKPKEIAPGVFTWESDLSFQRTCSKSEVGNFLCPKNLYCGNPEEYMHLELSNEDYQDRLYINFGVTNFDNLGRSFLTVFQMITSETWYYQIQNTMDLDIPIIGGIYCFAVIIVGQFFLLNLILAVMIEGFKKSHEQRLQEALNILEHQDDYEPGSEEIEEDYDEIENEEHQSQANQDQEYGNPEGFDESGGQGESDERAGQGGEDNFMRQSLTQHPNKDQHESSKMIVETPSTIIGRSKTFAGNLKLKLNLGTSQDEDTSNNQGASLQKRDAKGLFKNNVKKLLNRKSSSKNLPVINEGEKMSMFTVANTVLKKSKTIRMHKGASETQPITPAKKMADLVGHSKQFKDERQKYEEQQDFSVFMKELVLKRRVVNMFIKAGEKKSMFERVNEMANKAQQEKLFEEKLKKVENEQKQSNNNLTTSVRAPLTNQVQRPPAIIVEEMKEEDVEKRDSFLGQECANRSSANIGSTQNFERLGVGSPDRAFRAGGAIRNQSNNLYNSILDRPTQKNGPPIRELSAQNINRTIGVDDFELKNMKPLDMQNQTVNKSFMKKQTVKEPTVYQVVQHMLQNPKVLKEGIQRFKTRQIEDEFVQQFQSNAVKSTINNQKSQKRKRKKSKKGDPSQNGDSGIETKTFKSGFQRDKKTSNDIVVEDLQQNEPKPKNSGVIQINTNAAGPAGSKTSDRIGAKIVEGIVGPTDIEKKNTNEEDEQIIDCKVPETADHEANRVLKVLMTNFGASIRQKILQMQEEASKMESKQDKRRKSSRLIDLCARLTEKYQFSAVVICIVLGNEIVIGSDEYPISMERIQTIEYLNILITLLFMVELFIRVTATGLEDFRKVTKLNDMDAMIALVSIIDVFVANCFLDKYQLVNSAAITVLRATRTIRFFKLARYWQSFRVLLENLIETLQNIKIFAVLLIIFFYIYTILGMEFFAHQARININTQAIDNKNGVSPMYHFDNIMQAFFTTFVVFTNDGQSSIYYNFYRAVSPTLATLWWISFIVLTQKILLNLFLAILLEKFEEADTRQKIINEEQQNQTLDTQESIRGKNKFEEFIESLKNGYRSFLMKIKQPNSPEKQEEPQKDVRLMKSLTRELAAIYTQMKEQESPIQGRSLGLIGRDIRIRHFLYKVITHPKYDAVIVVCILISAVLLALDAPTLDPHSSMKQAIYWIDVVTIIIFTLECFIKIITFGFFFNGKFSYLRGMWNILDFIILIFSFLCLTSLVETFRVVKTFRILRCLRLIGRNEGLKVAVRALLFAIPNILQITVIMFLFHSIFAVITMSYFKGKSYYCINYIPTLHKVIEVQEEIIHHDAAGHQLPTKWGCMDQGGLWVNRLFNFDNIMNSLISLFVMSTTAGWSDIVVQNISGENEFDMMGNEHGNRPAAWTLFFMFYMIVAHFFFLNLFIVVVISTFKSEQNRVGGGDLLTNKQKEWIDLRLLILRSQPIKKLKEPSQNWKKIFYRIQSHKHFEKVIQIAIILNTATLMIKWYRQPPEVDKITEIVNEIFTIIFISEAAIRIIGIGLRNYLKDGWNVFDLFVAAGSLVSILISASTEVEIKAVSLLRAFRILRLLRLLKRGGKSLYLIFNTFVITMQSLANIGGLLLLMMYIYSIIGMIYFGEVKRNSSMSDYINFESFTSAFITLFTVATVDSWNYTMISFSYVLSPANQCVESPTHADYVNNGHKMMGCGNPQNTFAFFISFMFLVSLVFLKLFIAIILEGYKETQTQDGRLFNDDMNQRFREVWAEYDPEATTFITLKDLRPFLFDLGAPLGFDESFNESRFLQDKFIASLELPTYHNFQSYQFLDILDALSFRLMVLDHINKLHQENEDQKLQKSASLRGNNQAGQTDVHQKLFEIDEREIKGKIEQEVNRLLYQKQSENIVAFKELWEKEQRKKQNREKNKDVSGLTSSHHMALEMVIRKIKVILHEKRELRRIAAEMARAEALRRQKEEEERQRQKQQMEDADNDPNTSRNLLLINNISDLKQQQETQSHSKLGFFKKFTRKLSMMSSQSKPE